jgi:uncharacterized protein GlcG (DUF336 family)
MDGAPSAGAEIAQATAAAAASFACPSAELVHRHGGPASLEQLAAALPFAILAAPGAVPILENGVAIGAIGVGGPPETVCAELAAEARDSV